jgi:hypothetical protein
MTSFLKREAGPRLFLGHYVAMWTATYPKYNGPLPFAPKGSIEVRGSLQQKVVVQPLR